MLTSPSWVTLYPHFLYLHLTHLPLNLYPLATPSPQHHICQRMMVLKLLNSADTNSNDTIGLAAASKIGGRRYRVLVRCSYGVLWDFRGLQSGCVRYLWMRLIWQNGHLSVTYMYLLIYFGFLKRSWCLDRYHTCPLILLTIKQLLNNFTNWHPGPPSFAERKPGLRTPGERGRN
jgi:hypothetical protein